MTTLPFQEVSTTCNANKCVTFGNLILILYTGVPPNVQALKHFSAAQWRVSNGSRISLGSANTDINDMSLSISIFQPPPPPPRYSTIDIPQLGPKSS